MTLDGIQDSLRARTIEYVMVVDKKYQPFRNTLRNVFAAVNCDA